MAIDRRDFLKFVVGGAVGTVISPLPWVSMDEVAKWSQRWALIPEKGGDSFIHSTCLLCPGGCGIRVRLIEEKRAVKIDGNPFHPVNRGGMCPLGLAGLQYLYQEDIRVKSPLKRTGGRGSGQWKPLSWAEAISEVTSRLKELRQNNLSHTVAFLNGEGEGSQAQLAARFLKAYGSPNYIQPFQMGDLEAILTQTLYGVRTRLSYDLPRALYILSFGSALLDGWGNPSWTTQAFQEWRRESSRQGRAKLVQIDTMATATASLAEDWVAIKPDTEGILALGLAQVIIEKGWMDTDFVRTKISGLEELKKFLDQGYKPDQVAAETTVSQETIITLAKDFSSAKHQVALWGKGKGELPVSLFEAQAVHLLNLLVGSVNRPGGIYLQSDFPYTAWPKLSLDETARKGLAQPRLDGALSKAYPKTEHLAGRFFAKTILKKPYPINVLLIHEANPVFSLGEKNILPAVNEIPFIVSFSTFLDETTSQADLILPASTFLERWGDRYGCLGVPFPVYGLTKPILPPLHDTQSLGEALLHLAKDLGGSVREALPFENMEEVIKQSARVIYGARKGRLTDQPPSAAGKSIPSFESFDKFWEQLVTQGTWYDPEIKGAAGKGRWNFSPSTLQPRPQEKTQSGQEYPLWLVPQSLLLLQSGFFPNPPFLTKYLGEETLKKNKLVVQIHPQTAQSLSLREGDRVEIKSAQGMIEARIHLFEGAMPDCVFVPLGMGHKAYDPTLKNRGANPYPMLDTRVDSLTGLDVAWATQIKIQKV